MKFTSIKQNIVAVNKYTIKDKKTGRGSKGSSPANYVKGYMTRTAKDGGPATMDSTQFINSSVDGIKDYVSGYMVRDDAVEPLHHHHVNNNPVKTKVDEAKSVVKKVETDSLGRLEAFDGVGFNKDSLAMTRAEVDAFADELDVAYNDYKTVLITVLSWSTDYLQECGVVSKDIQLDENGEVVEDDGVFRGNVDQVKLRHAIRQGLEAMAQDYDDLRYIGTIQVDTGNVHCHLAMYDAGVGSIVKGYGTQRGKILEKSQKKLRRRIDATLDDTKTIAYLSSNIEVNRRNLKLNIANVVFSQSAQYGVSQMLFSVLPDNQKLWRAGSNAKEMQVPHEICRNFVKHMVANNSEQFDELKRNIESYVEERKSRENLKVKECKQLYKKCEDKFYADCEQAIYKTLKQIPDKYRHMSVDFLTLVEDEHISADSDLQNFVYRAKSCMMRYDKHRRNADKYDEYVKEYESTQNPPESSVLCDFYKNERDYHLKMSNKYYRMLFFDDDTEDEDLINDYRRVIQRAELIENMKLLRDDPDVKKYKSNESLQAYAEDRYGLDMINVGLLLTSPEIYDRMLERFEEAYREDYTDVIAKVRSYSKVAINDKENDEIVLVDGRGYDFDEIRGLDLHDVRYDFGKTFEFDGEVRMAFMENAKTRLDLYWKACDYLRSTNQDDLIEIFDPDEFVRMYDIYTKLQNNEVIINDDAIMELQIEEALSSHIDHETSHELLNDIIEIQSSIDEKYFGDIKLEDDEDDGFLQDL